jgi:hypothetical protein
MQLTRDGYHFKKFVAIDAIDYRKHSDDIFDAALIKRDLVKASIGFKTRIDSENMPVSTGGWGTGIFKVS